MQEDVRLTINQVLSKFDNPFFRYNESVTFKNTVDSIVNGTDLFEIIDKLIEMNDNKQKEFEKYVSSDVRPILIEK